MGEMASGDLLGLWAGLGEQDRGGHPEVCVLAGGAHPLLPKSRHWAEPQPCPSAQQKARPWAGSGVMVEWLKGETTGRKRRSEVEGPGAATERPTPAGKRAGPGAVGGGPSRFPPRGAAEATQTQPGVQRHQQHEARGEEP